MYTSCLEREKEPSLYSNEHTCQAYDIQDYNLYQSETFQKLKKIPIKIILSDNEEVYSTAEMQGETFDKNSSGSSSPSGLENLTTNFIRFSNTNVNNFTIGKKFFRFFLNN